MSGVLGGLIAAFPTPVTGSFESIATATGDGSSGTITFSSIPQTYASLHIRIYGRMGNTQMIRFNGVTTTTYARHQLKGNGTAASAGASTADTSILGGAEYTSSANIGGVTIVDIHNYSSTTQYKTLRMFNGYDENGSGAVYLTSGLWVSTDAITSVTFTMSGGTWLSGTTISLYGIKGA